MRLLHICEEISDQLRRHRLSGELSDVGIALVLRSIGVSNAMGSDVKIEEIYEECRDALYRMSWLLFIRDPMYDPSQPQANIALLELIAKGAANIEALFVHCRKMARMSQPLCTIELPSSYHWSIRAYNRLLMLRGEDLRDLVILPISEHPEYGCKTQKSGNWLSRRERLVQILDKIELLAELFAPNDAQSYLRRGLRRYNEGDCDGALSDMQQVIALDRDCDEAYLCAADICVDLGLYDEAMGYLGRGLISQPEHVKMLHKRGQLSVQLGVWDRGLSDYTRALASATSQRFAIYTSRALLYEQLGDTDRALADYAAAISDAPRWPPLYANRAALYQGLALHHRAVADYSRAIELMPSHADYYLSRSLSFEAIGDICSAVQDLDTVIGLEPTRLEALLRRGILHKRSGELKLARSDLSTILAREEHVDALYQLGHLHGLCGDWDAAVCALSRCLSLQHDHALAYFARSEAYEALGKSSLAIADALHALRWSDASQLESSEVELRLRLMGYNGPISHPLAESPSRTQMLAYIESMPDEVFVQIGDYQKYAQAHLKAGEIDLAIDFFSAAINADPELYDSYISRANAYTLWGKYDLALCDLNRAIDLCPISDHAHYQRSQVLYELGDIPAAIADLDRALDLFPHNIDYLIQRGLLHTLLGQRTAMIADLQSALQLDPSDVSALHYLGNAYLEDKQFAQAIEIYDQLLDIEPHDLEALANRGAAKMQLGDLEGALQDWQQKFAIGGDNGPSIGDLIGDLLRDDTTQKESASGVW